MNRKPTFLLLVIVILWGMSLAFYAGYVSFLNPTETSTARKQSTIRFQDQDAIEFVYPGGMAWKIGYDHEEPGIGGITEYIRYDDNIENWRELLTIEDLILHPDKMPCFTPQSCLQMKINIMETECPGAYHWNTIEEGENRILYESKRIRSCKKWPYKQHEIGGVYVGRTHIYYIRYTVKTDQMDSETRKDLIERLSNANLILAISTPEP